MNLTDPKAFIDLMNTEYKRRADLLPEDETDTVTAYHQWRFTDLPFLHDLCILYLVAVRHHVERSLLFHATRALGQGERIERSEFEAQRKTLLDMTPEPRWQEIKRRLKPENCARYKGIEALRLLANSYKHDPDLQPNPKLVGHLGLDENLLYASIPESLELQKGLARIVDLPDDSQFPEITEKFVEHAEEFLKDVQAKNALSSVNWGPIRLDKFAV